MNRYFILFLFLSLSCKNPIDYKYKIEGQVKILQKPNSFVWDRQDTVIRKAFWYTDTFHIKNDTVVIKNTNGTEYRVAKPYKIKKLNLNK